MQNLNSICDDKLCSACGACKNICSKEAVYFKEDALKRTIAHIDLEKCINCGLCKKVCPVNNKTAKYLPQKCYAAVSSYDDYRTKCASGGVASSIARYIIQNGGVYYGVRFDESLTLVYDSAETEEDILKFAGSKYVQADTGYIYKDVKEKLNSGKNVLFVGTPCQVAGLKNYLQRDYEELVTVDLICHGVPPIKYLQEYTNDVTKKNISDISMRGEHNFFMVMYDSNNRIVYNKKSQGDTYFTAFLEGLVFRSNCYTCDYACKERVADITIGDFWGIDRATLKEKYDGSISVVLANTDKGLRIIDNLKDEFTIEERELDEAVKNNGQLLHPSKMHFEREVFEKKYPKYGFKKAANTKTVKRIKAKYQRMNNKTKLKIFIKKILGR